MMVILLLIRRVKSPNERRLLRIGMKFCQAPNQAYLDLCCYYMWAIHYLSIGKMRPLLGEKDGDV